jgi:hypothetical protein
MKLGLNICIFSLTILSSLLFAQTNGSQRLFFPFLDEACQSNIVVTVSDLDAGQPCPAKYSNILSNTNLFSPEEQKVISSVFEKYKKVTTNSGPVGTTLADLYKTNFTIKAAGRTFQITNWVARYQYTNIEANETIFFGSGIMSQFRTKSNNGYNVSISRTGEGSMLRFMEIRQGLINGLLAEFDDAHSQGVEWDYRLADFNKSYMTEYCQYTNGMVLGKFLMWNPLNNNLGLEAEFKEPCDFEKHKVNPFAP